jgi:FkbM family methyltransferase
MEMHPFCKNPPHVMDRTSNFDFSSLFSKASGREWFIVSRKGEKKTILSLLKVPSLSSYTSYHMINHAFLIVKHNLLRMLRHFPEVYLKLACLFPFRSLNGIDKILLDFLPDQGLFLEAGANDGILQSNTFYLEKSKKWTGILIEPIPSLFKVLSKTRSGCICLNVALVGDNNPGFIKLFNNDLMSSINDLDESYRHHVKVKNEPRIIYCKTKTVSSIMKDFNLTKIDFVSLDVEGSEIQILEDLITNNLNIPFLLVETNNFELVNSLIMHNYSLLKKITFHDYLFLKI